MFIASNTTKVPNEVILPLLEKAAKAIHMHAGKVAVWIRKGLPGYYSGRAWCNCDMIKMPSGNWKRCKGLFAIVVKPSFDNLRRAGEIYNTTLHELAHIHDGHLGKRFCDYNKLWKNRPHEKRAINACKRALDKNNGHEFAADEILNLAIVLDELRRKENEKD